MVLGAGLLVSGCHLDMVIQPKVKSQSENDFFADGKGTRLPVEGAVEYGKPKTDSAFYTGYDESGQLVSEMPVKVDERLIKRGKERFEIFCTHCHGDLGDGQGMIAQRGFALARPVGNYHTQRLRDMPVGHYFDVITNGYGTMYGHASRIKPLDRWAIASYIRVLQFSQAANPNDLDADTRKALGLSGSGTGSGVLFKTATSSAPAAATAPVAAAAGQAPAAGQAAPVTTEEESR